MRESLSRAAVVAAAKASLEKVGPENLSLRGVARDLGVTAPALYAYVHDNDDLLAALPAEHFEALVERFEAVDETDPIERIRGLSRAYVDHALSSPALFHLMFKYPALPVPGIEVFPPAARAFETAAAATASAMEAGLLSPRDPQLANLTM